MRYGLRKYIERKACHRYSFSVGKPYHLYNDVRHFYEKSQSTFSGYRKIIIGLWMAVA